MQTDLEKARATLARLGCACVLCKGDDVIACTGRGVKPLLELLDSGFSYRGYAAADKVVGKAAAMLLCRLGVRSVSAGVMTRAAEQILLRHGIAVLWNAQTDVIINRAGTGPCPMETATAGIDDPVLGEEVIRARLKTLQ
jgi:hypothetical protein